MPEASQLDRNLPDGFSYRSDFLSPAEEAQLVHQVARVRFENFEMRGVIARRRVAFFGRGYDDVDKATAPMPEFLDPLRHAVGEWARIDPAAFVMALINEYPAGAPIGWHRDAPQYDRVVGISLLSPCRMKFRPYVAGRTTSVRRTATHEIVLAPRSAYLLAGEARNSFEHHIPAVAALRYSITFRTLRSRRKQHA